MDVGLQTTYDRECPGFQQRRALSSVQVHTPRLPSTAIILAKQAFKRRIFFP